MRSINSLKNFIASLGGQLLAMALGFASRTVFIYTLSEAYLGINGLFSSILTVLGLAELGVGPAILYALYKPVGEGDKDKIRSLMLFYRNAYRIIGFVIFGIGVALIPLLPFIMKETTDLVNVRIVYVLYLLETASSYWFFAYKQNLLTAYQKDYINALIRYVSTFAKTVVQIAALLVLRNTPALAFYIYTAVGVLSSVLYNILAKRRAERTFPDLDEKGALPLTKEEKQPILKNVVGLFSKSISGVALTATDNILISSFISVGAVGIYGNYLALKGYVVKVISTFFYSLSVSIGNFCATESRERQEEFFDSLFFTYFWVYGFCAICFWVLYNTFIAGVWLRDTKWLMSDAAVFLICLNFLLDGLSGAVTKFRDANGLYWQTRFRYILSAVFNVIVSYVLMVPLKMGVVGVLLGTTASIVIMISVDPIIVFREVFGKKAAGYYLTFFGYLALILATGAVTALLCRPFSEYNLLNCVIRAAICTVVPNALWFVLFRKSKRFIYLRDKVVRLAGHFARKLARGNS